MNKSSTTISHSAISMKTDNKYILVNALHMAPAFCTFKIRKQANTTLITYTHKCKLQLCIPLSTAMKSTNNS